MKSANKPLSESLAESRAGRIELILRYGFVPMSILRITRGTSSRNVFNYQREYGSLNVSAKTVGAVERCKTEKTRKRHLERIARGITGGGVALETKTGDHSSRIQVSMMPPELVEYFIRYYSAAGQTYIDPFMGQGIRFQVAVRMRMNYIGFDVAKSYCRFIDAIKPKLPIGDLRIETYCHDARDMSAVADNTGDFCFTSPPYWNVEYYGDEPDQLGNATYPAFLESMRSVAAELLRVMKPGAIAVINTNDFRKNNVFYPYHADLIKTFQSAGWIAHDIWIIEGLVGGLSRIFAVERHDTRLAPKVHEYAMVFRKPSAGPAGNGVKTPRGKRTPAATATTADAGQTARKSQMVTISVSGKCLREPFVPCSPEYIRDVCHGRCCWSSTEIGGVSVVVHDSEIAVIRRRISRQNGGNEFRPYLSERISGADTGHIRCGYTPPVSRIRCGYGWPISNIRCG